MLLYHGCGQRELGDGLRPPEIRGRWEFLAVVSGRCGMLTPGRTHPSRAATAWLLPPESCHSWHGDHRPCRIVVFHAAAMAEPWAGAARSAGFLCVNLDPAAIQRLVALSGRVATDTRSDMRLSEQLERLAMAEVAITLLPALAPPSRRPAGRDADRLTRALAWFDEHMDQAPDAAVLAGALGIGPAQLRRICRNIRGLKLGTLLDERRLERARALLVDSSLSLAGIARASGWRSASALSHAMQRRHACSPSELRRRMLS